MEKKTCADRVRGHYASRLADLRKFRDAGWENVGDDDLGEFDEYGLSFDYVEPEGRRQGFYRYLLSWGGPSDEFGFFVNPGGLPYRIEYWFMDWFDGAKVELESAPFEVLCDCFRQFSDCGMTEVRYG
jgi:hypothetical protein